MAISAIMVAAFKKYMLISLLKYGKVRGKLLKIVFHWQANGEIFFPQELYEFLCKKFVLFCFAGGVTASIFRSHYRACTEGQ